MSLPCMDWVKYTISRGRVGGGGGGGGGAMEFAIGICCFYSGLGQRE